MSESESSFEEVSKQLVIKWESDIEKRAEFINHATLFADENTYCLRFYQVLPLPEEINEEETNVVSGRHVVTLVVSRGDMAKIAGLLNRAVERENTE